MGKEKAKKIRREGSIPAIIYSKNVNMPIQLMPLDLKALRSVHFSQSAIIDMEIVNGNKKESHSVLIKDVQYHPLSEAITHIDFIKVSLEEKIKVNVSLVLKGEPKGIKEGGILEQIMWQLTLEGLPLDIPEKIEIDVSELDIGDSIHVGDIKVKDNLRMVSSAEETVATVVAKKEEEVAVPAEEAAPTGPEVIKEKKEGEEGEEAEDKEEAKPKEEPKVKEEAKGKEEKGKKIK
jgi:large subunit ribosomal protein L25